MVVYDRLWETMKQKGISQYRLIKYFKFSAAQINRLRTNSYVSTHTIDILCSILNCRVEDIMEFQNDPSIQREVEISRQNGEKARQKAAKQSISQLYADEDEVNADSESTKEKL